MSTRIDTELAWATVELQALDGHELDAQLLLCHVLGQPRSYLFTWPEKTLSTAEQVRFEQLVQQRAKGIPVAYLTGSKEFWSLELKVNDDVIIPRPDTELLVELALSRPLGESAQVADLGTGSGAIALAIAGEKPGWQVLATDKSPQALATAQDNARHHRINNVRFLTGSWCQPLGQQRLDMIVSNPPYIRADDLHLNGPLRFEPYSALVSGKDGLDDIRQIIQAAWAHLHPGGWLLLEHGHDQGAAVAALMSRQGYRQIDTRTDLAGHDRVTLGQAGSG